MKIELALPEDLGWLKEILSERYEHSERLRGAGSSGVEPLWASGHFQATKEVIEAIESRYEQIAEDTRERYERAGRPAEPPDEIRLERLGLREVSGA